uniref:Uncharacterized protein n=1 Tax=Knipowitschia caucasica TaxID=637954 RepID=A0AAV2LX07_KNICA
MQRSGMKGRGVCILHTYLDTLWAFGDKSGPPSLPESEEQDVSSEACDQEDEQGTGTEAAPCSDEVIHQVCTEADELSLADPVQQELDTELQTEDEQISPQGINI